MGITRRLINWCDKKFEDALHEPDDRKSTRDAAVSGFVEGVIDGAVIMYVPVLIACCVYKHMANKK